MVIGVDAIEIEILKNVVELSAPRLAKARMPERGGVRCEEAVVATVMCSGGAQRVQVAGGVTAEQHRSRPKILDGETTGIKCHRDRVVGG